MKELKALLEQLGFEHLPMMSDYVVIQRKVMLRHKDYKNDLGKYVDVIYEYANFITQTLTKGQFIPCDLDGNVLEEPESYGKHLEIEGENHSRTGWNKEDLAHGFHKQCKEYEQAQERVIFEDVEDVFFEKSSDKFTVDFEGAGVYTIDNGSFNELYYTIEKAINNGVKLKLI